jgi:hypothetical protein
MTQDSGFALNLLSAFPGRSTARSDALLSRGRLKGSIWYGPGSAEQR